MKKIIIFGTGENGKKEYQKESVKEDVEIVAFADNFPREDLYGLPVVQPEKLKEMDFNVILIASMSANEIEAQLLMLGIPQTKIIKTEVQNRIWARKTFLHNFSEECYIKNIPGNVAEAGTFRGEFAAVINACFPNKTIYIFDTFEGFHADDVLFENKLNEEDGSHSVAYDYYAGTSEDIVRKRLPYPDKSVIVKGYVPESLKNIDDEFCFVNLDMDLYQPTLRALEWFWPRMVDGGVVLIHDYFDTNYVHLRKAVRKFVEDNEIYAIPIGDDLSIALLK